jgi:DNA-directed RNA polymerase subunit M/transcription elongation factor TFIIS
MIQLSAKFKNLNDDARTAGIVQFSRERAVSNGDGTLDEWQSRISKDRPVYACPKCSERAMQFYATRALLFDRTDFFHCHACGNSWEI